MHHVILFVRTIQFLYNVCVMAKGNVKVYFKYFKATPWGSPAAVRGGKGQITNHYFSIEGSRPAKLKML